MSSEAEASAADKTAAPCLGSPVHSLADAVGPPDPHDLPRAIDRPFEGRREAECCPVGVQTPLRAPCPASICMIQHIRRGNQAPRALSRREQNEEQQCPHTIFSAEPQRVWSICSFASVATKSRPLAYLRQAEASTSSFIGLWYRRCRYGDSGSEMQHGVG